MLDSMEVRLVDSHVSVIPLKSAWWIHTRQSFHGSPPGGFTRVSRSMEVRLVDSHVSVIPWKSA